MFKRMKEKFQKLGESRLTVIAILFALMSFILICKCFNLQIIHGQDYLNNYKLQIQKTREIPGTRGVIYDRNGKVLAENKVAYTITMEDTYESGEEKNKQMNATISKVIDIIERNGDEIISDFGIVLDSNDEYTFVAQSETAKLRFIADVFGKATIDKLTKEQKASTASDLIHYLCTDERYGYEINEKKLSKHDVLKIVNIRYAIGLNSFQKYIPTLIASDVNEETVAEVMENLDTLQGIEVNTESLRSYPDSKYFSSILGYTGKISLTEYEKYTSEGKSYSKTDIVGKAGLEQSMDTTLQGKSGKETLYVNNVGKVIERTKVSNAKAGNNLYLSIDKDLQIATYNILEEQLAGILLANMRNVMNYNEEITYNNVTVIPFDEVLTSFFANNILDLRHFSEKGAKETEKTVYKKYQKRSQSAIASIEAELKDSTPKQFKDLSKEMQSYMSYIGTDVLLHTTGVLMSEKIDKNDDIYLAWKNDSRLSLREYLLHAISKNWVDTSKLKPFMAKESGYSDSNEIYEALIAYIKNYLSTNLGFSKLVYKYMIKDQTITGREVCIMLFEQKILKENKEDYNAIVSGKIGAYDFIRRKIKSLEITPGQLGLEPCTASAVVTDVNTGAVLACVSYPGYDNNRLANSMDSAYYNQLVTGLSKPLYNNATQETTAPGSTFKMVTAIAGLTEGVISPDTSVSCGGQFTKVVPGPKCWISPGAHGSLNVTGAIQHSCNVFFSEVGYRLSMKGHQQYSDDQGLHSLQTYAKLFGLDQPTGLEIPESSSKISDEDAVRSSFGQGTHKYTVSQLARYVSTVANKGTLYDLTLLKKIESSDGKTIKEFAPKKADELDSISDSTWNIVHKGMKNMIATNSIFSSVRQANFSMSGKTGTTQQSKLHPDHGLFVGFAPSDQPEIGISVRIANAHKSAFAAEVGRDIVRYHFKLAKPSEIIHKEASNITTVVTGD